MAAIVDGWKAENDIPQIERDIALGELRAIYDELLVVDVEAVDSTESVDEVEDTEQEIEVEVVIEETPIEEESAEEEASAISDVASMESFYNALDIDALLGLNEEPKAEENAESAPVAKEQTSEPTPEVVEEPEPIAEEQTPEPIAEPEPEPAPAPAVEEPKPMGAGLFDLNDIPVRSKSRRKMISLYSDNPLPVQSATEPAKPEPKVEENRPVEDVAKIEEAAPVVEPTPEPTTVAPQMRLGDTFSGVKTLADQMAKDDVATTPFNRITELRQAIGLNDKFLMIRDLFGGDAARYEATIDTLDEFDDLDECIIYIVENFRWNPDLEAAKLLVSLIERKLA